MNNDLIITIFSVVAMCIMAIAAILIIVAVVQHLRRKRDSASKYIIGRAALQSMGLRLSRDSYWFSESIEAHALLNVISKHLRDIDTFNGYGDEYVVDALRADWRAEVERMKCERSKSETRMLNMGEK